MKAAKIMFWVAVALLVGAVFALSIFFVRQEWWIVIIGMALLIAALILIILSFRLLVRHDEAQTQLAASKEAPKAH
jgi:Ca2+/Na+ antiporter